MKSVKKRLLQGFVLILPMLFLCSCYEIVYVSQEKDNYPQSLLQPDVCIQVYMLNDKPVTPYFGVLLPKSWDIVDGIIYTKDQQNTSVKIGSIYYDDHLSKDQEKLDPAPAGYIWWVGVGDQFISENGVYKAHPKMHSGSDPGLYKIDYMIGDSETGLNVLRSDNHEHRVADSKSVVDLNTSVEGTEIMLTWKPPMADINIMGYYVYRNGSLVNNVLIQENTYTEKNLPAGSYSYVVVPVFMNGKLGSKCGPQKVCYAACGTSVIFNGEDSRLIVLDDPSLHLTGTFTLEAWINSSDLSNPEPRIISKGEKGTGYELLLTNSGKKKTLDFRTPMGRLKSLTPISIDTWYHVAAVYTGSLLQIFINGEFDCERYVVGSMNYSSYPLTIGKASNCNDHYFHGLIDEVRIWNQRRTATEIKEFFSSEVNNNSMSLVGNWRMSEGCNQISCDASTYDNNAFLAGSCWSPAKFPYVEEVHNQYNYGLLAPVINYLELKDAPDDILLEFKINPMLLKYEGIVTDNTLLSAYDTKIAYQTDGTIQIKAKKKHDVLMQNEVLLYVDLKALQPHVITTLKFNECEADGYSFRVGSGKIIATALPDKSVAGKSWTNEENSLVTVFPNPATTQINIQLGNMNEHAELSVLNITGQVVYKYTLNENDSNTIHKIDLSGFSKGIYLISLQQSGNNTVKKFAVN